MVTTQVDFKRLVESGPSWGEPIDITEFLKDTPGFLTGPTAMNATQIYDRDDGRYRPVYNSEIDLRIIRAMSWLLYERVPMARAWVERLTDYTISTGFDWTITSKNHDQLAKRCKVLVDRVLRQNDWTSELERESYQREVVDGESILELEWCDGDIAMHFRECDELTEPANKAELERYYGIDDYVPSWSYGILSRRNRSDRPLAYHFVRDPAGNDWDLVKGCNVAHWKRNVRRKAKRGVGDFYTPHVYLLKGDKVFTRTADGTATQASIAYIVKHGPGTTPTQAASFTSMARYTGRMDPVTGARERAVSMNSGTRLDVKGADYYAGPLGTNNSKIYVEVMSAAMQLAGTIKAFPDGMLTGASADGGFASALVAQSPFVQGRVAEQNQRANRLEKLIIKILSAYCRCGALEEYGCDDLDDLMCCITIAVTPPPVVPIDKAALATALKTQADAGWLSDKTAMQELGRDYETEQANLNEQAKVRAARAPQPPAGPGGLPVAPAPGTVPGGGGVGHDPNAPAPPGSRGEQTQPGDVMPESKLTKAQKRLVEAWADYP